jgi:hypothetical protein
VYNTRTIPYDGQQDLQTYIDLNPGMRLCEIKNITEGDFLVFTDEPAPIEEEKPTYEELENQLLIMADSQAGGIL